MKTNEFTPQESFKLINQVIKEAKNRFEQNGSAFILWGLLIPLSSFSQAYLIYNDYYSISWYPYLILPLAMIYTIYYYNKKAPSKHNHFKLISSRLWLFTGFNIMIVAFGFSTVLKHFLTPFILLLLGIATVVEGSFIRSKILLFCGIILNLSSYVAFFIPWKHHPLLMEIVSILALLLPGLLLRYIHKNQDV